MDFSKVKAKHMAEDMAKLAGEAGQAGNPALQHSASFVRAELERMVEAGEFDNKPEPTA